MRVRKRGPEGGGEIPDVVVELVPAVAERLGLVGAVHQRGAQIGAALKHALQFGVGLHRREVGQVLGQRALVKLGFQLLYSQLKEATLLNVLMY